MLKTAFIAIALSSPSCQHAINRMVQDATSPYVIELRDGKEVKALVSRDLAPYFPQGSVHYPLGF